MRTFDFSPLLRSSIGFDGTLDRLRSAAEERRDVPHEPAYDIETTGEDAGR